MTVRIEDLEVRLNQKTYLRNEVVISTDEETAVYVGEAIGLHFDGMDIRGKARLSRYDRTKGTKNKRKLVQWLPPKFQTEEVPFVNDTRLWKIDSGEYNHEYFLSYGELQTGYDCTAHYRAALKGAAANIGLKLSHELFEMVFEPIDSEILDMYKQARRID
jgi:hypothetical protein